MNKLTYQRYNRSDNVITIDLQNGYSVIAISGWQPDTRIYVTTLFLKDNQIDTWKLMEEFSALEFHASAKTINSAILKEVSSLLAGGHLQYYIDRYDYEMSCFAAVNEIVEKERLKNVS